ncbi:hypothetical protein JIN84_11660 [Luteolibacter yonseiensis]|uniref:Uncharacterized protein n=1 Tax=Luteolibacter yonseiensis TaxID=1144680 RepID=A0A934R4U6_9BACT|nr:hypothetical protein [Luteolibacter yonseiensis]MBK1816271.1 hypothetical protein [Luteolibacter yonseiensis]
MPSFKTAYTSSAILTCLLSTSGLIGSVGSGAFDIRMLTFFLSTAVAAAFPLLKKGGLGGNPRLAVLIAALLTITFGMLISMAFIDFIRTGGGEGPRGEGSPLINMIAIALGATLAFSPWLITTLRGLPHWHAHSRRDRPVDPP